MRKLGIIGGASWASTALYYEQINRGVAARLGGLHSAVMAIESLDMAPFAAMQQSGDWGGVARVAIEAAKRVRASGAEGLLLASNTLHKVHDEITEATGLPILHIAYPTAEKLVADGVKRIGLLGSRFTMAEEFVRGPIEACGIAIMPMHADVAREVDRIIYEELAAGRVVRSSQRTLKTLITEMGKIKTQAIVLGCTELVLAVDTRSNVLPVYDTTAIHARAAVEWMLGEREAVRAAA